MKHKLIGFESVELTEGFWKERQTLVREVTLGQVREQFEGTGRFAAFDCDWREGQPLKPHIFWDSDVAKWIESAAYFLRKKRDAELENYIDDLISKIDRHRCEDGYFNIYFLAVEPSKRWRERDCHELYCAGHLIEAAVAYYEATGKDKFLKIMCDYADYIERVFVRERSAAFTTPGHEEIELALVRLWHCTGEKRYLELSKFFVDMRGNNDEERGHRCFSDDYLQDRIPVREQSNAVGHSVRACYLYSAMADLAGEYGDEGLLLACKRVFESITQKRMYVTGGIGSSRDGECFTDDYDLPNDRAYAETCAAIALVFFASRMLGNEPDSSYADAAERALFNGVLPGLSLDGERFFYENPLEINLADRQKLENRKRGWPITQRPEIFGCSCCPPNVTRLLASLGGCFYSQDGETLYVHHYASSTLNAKVGGASVSLSQRTDYPFGGKVALSVNGMKNKALALRIPSWSAESFSLLLNGEPAIFTVKNGYAFLDITKNDAELILSLDMTPRWIYSNPHVSENAGRVALQRGPIVFCTEAVDNGSELWRLAADTTAALDEGFDDALGLPTLIARGERDADFGELYTYAPPTAEQTDIKFIPYFAFANRGESDMSVWIRSK